MARYLSFLRAAFLRRSVGLLLCLLVCSAALLAQADFEDDRVMLQGFYWESYRHGHPTDFPEYGNKHWYAIVKDTAAQIREGRFSLISFYLSYFIIIDSARPPHRVLSPQIQHLCKLGPVWPAPDFAPERHSEDVPNRRMALLNDLLEPEYGLFHI